MIKRLVASTRAKTLRAFFTAEFTCIGAALADAILAEMRLPAALDPKTLTDKQARATRPQTSCGAAACDAPTSPGGAPAAAPPLSASSPAPAARRATHV